MANTNKSPVNGSSQGWGQGFGVEAETGDGMLVGTAFAGAFGYVKTGAYGEQGGLTALRVGSTSDTHFLMEAGPRHTATYGLTTFKAVAGWREDFGTLDTTVSEILQNSASVTSTYDINVRSFFGGVGFTMIAAQDFAFEAAVSGIIGSDHSSIDGQIGLKKKF
tara:strand:+ start:81050 stop:81541 length:492 start_codon:yes stop_codon:yes gene_type:complete